MSDRIIMTRMKKLISTSVKRIENEECNRTELSLVQNKQVTATVQGK